MERLWGESLGEDRREGGREGECGGKPTGGGNSACTPLTPPSLSERLCADPGLSLHALLAPDMAVPAVLAEMIDQLLTEEGLRTR